MTRSVRRFFHLLPAALKDTWEEAQGKRCSWNCGEGHVYDEWCILKAYRDEPEPDFG